MEKSTTVSFSPWFKSVKPEFGIIIIIKKHFFIYFKTNMKVFNLEKHSDFSKNSRYPKPLVDLLARPFKIWIGITGSKYCKYTLHR